MGGIPKRPIRKLTRGQGRRMYDPGVHYTYKIWFKNGLNLGNHISYRLVEENAALGVVKKALWDEINETLEGKDIVRQVDYLSGVVESLNAHQVDTSNEILHLLRDDVRTKLDLLKDQRPEIFNT